MKQHLNKLMNNIELTDFNYSNLYLTNDVFLELLSLVIQTKEVLEKSSLSPAAIKVISDWDLNIIYQGYSFLLFYQREDENCTNLCIFH